MLTLVRFNAARQALMEARSIDEVKDARDKAEALRLYSIQQRDGLEMQNDIAEIKIRGERRRVSITWHTEKRKLRDLMEYEKNPRQLSQYTK